MAISQEKQKLARRMGELLASSALALVLGASAQAADDEIVVIGERGEGLEESSISRLTQPLVDTPQSISTVSQFELESRAISNLNDALRATPGITLGAGEFSWQGNSPTIRGFVARSDFYLDGMRDFGNYYRDPFNTQQLEILQGPSSIYFGRGSTGGVINQTSKRPTEESTTHFTVAGGTDDTYRATADVNRTLGEGVAGRVTAMAHHNEVAGRDGGEMSRWGVAPSLAMELGPATRLSASYFHQSENNVPDYGVPWYFGRPAPVDRETFYGYETDFLDTDVDIATARVEHSVNANVTVRDQVRYGRYTRDFSITEAVIQSGVTPATPLEDIDVDLNIWSARGDEETFLQNQLDMLATFDTGGIGHTLVAGVEAGRETSQPNYQNTVPRPVKTLVDPVNTGTLPDSSFTYLRLGADTDADTLALFAVDTIALSPKWEATLGVRWDSFDADYRSTQIDGALPTGPGPLAYTTTRIDQKSEATSWRGALVYKPTETVNIYGAFGTSFNPSAEDLSQITSGRGLGVGNANLDPEENESYELGAKAELFDTNVILSGALFHMEKTNARVPDPDNPGFNTLEGEQQVDGAQVQIAGDITDAWYLNFGYTYLDSEVTRSTVAAAVGRDLLNAPEHAATLLSEYRVTDAATVGVSATYLGERLAQNTGATPLVAPDYVTVDLMGRYALNEHASLQLNVFNVGDETYYDQLHPWHVVPGAARSALLTLDVRY